VGGVSGRAGVKAGGIPPPARTPSRVVTVKDIPPPGKAALFAGRRPNERLGRSVVLLRASTRAGAAPMTADVRRQPRRGTSSRLRSESAGTGARTRDRRMRMADASFARSFDPRASILTMHETAKACSWWGGRIRYHGWANPRERDEPTLGPDDRTERGSPRATAPARERRGTEEKEGGQGRRPCEDHEPGFALVRRVQVAEVGRRPLASNKLGTRAPKRAVRVE